MCVCVCVCGWQILTNHLLKIWQVEAAASALEASCPAQPSKTKLSGVWDARLEITVGNRRLSLITLQPFV